MALTFKDMTIDDIIKWCKDNKQVSWLKREMSKTISVTKYTRRIPKVNGKGEEMLNKKGNKIYVADKSSPKQKETRNIDFMTIKRDFCKQFMPELLPVSKKSKVPTMYDLVAALPDDE